MEGLEGGENRRDGGMRETGDGTFEFLDLVFDAGESLVGGLFGVEGFFELGLEFFVVGVVDFFFFGGWSCGHGSGGCTVKVNNSGFIETSSVNIYVIFSATNLRNLPRGSDEYLELQ
jgi:hypothetical protein